MPWHIPVLIGHALIKGGGAAAGKHIYEKAVKEIKKKKNHQEPRQQPSSNQTDYSNYIYRDAVCDGCGEFISDDIRYHCFECPDYDLCENCNRFPYIATSKGVHYKTHRMLKMVETDQEPFANQRNYSAPAYSYGYSSAFCDVCGITITGIRYKCLNCPDFDLCERCHYLPPVYRSIKGHTAYHNMSQMIQ
jgi:next-to-BRCA1 protein 1